MTALRIRKLLRDVRATWVRSLLMVLAIAVSVAAVAAILSARTLIAESTNRGYLDTHPASATLVVEGGLDDRALEIARTSPGVTDVAARTSTLAQVKDARGVWRPLELFVRASDDAETINSVATETGTWPPATRTILLERTALPFLGTTIGDRLQVRLPGEHPSTVTVSGSVHDGGVAPAEQEQAAYGYATLDTLKGLGGASDLNQLKIIINDGSRDATGIEKTSQQVAATLTAAGYPVTEIQVPPPLRHPHQGQIDTVGVVLLAFGLAALLLSSVLVATMLGGMIAGQIRQIGAMKAIGASTGQLLWMYLVQTAAIAVVATVIAILPGLLLGRTLAEFAAAMLNVDLLEKPTPAWIFLAVVGAGVGVPLVAALIPLIRGSRMTVRDAIDDHGVESGAARGGRAPSAHAQASAALVRPLGLTQRFALRNLFRRRSRLVFTVALLSVAGATFITGLNTASGWSALVNQSLDNRHYDIEVRLDERADSPAVENLVGAVPGVATVEAWGRAPTAVHREGLVDVSRVYPDDAHASFTIMAPPVNTELVTLPLLSGRWLSPTDTNAVVLNNVVPPNGGRPMVVGDDLTLTVGASAKTFRIVGIVSDFGTQGTAYVNPSALAQPAAGTSMLRVVTEHHDAASRQEALREIEAALVAAGIGIGQDFTVDTLQSALDGHVVVLIDALIAIAAILGFVGLLGLATSLTTSVTERTREFAVLQVVGGTPSAIRRIVINEALFTAALSLVVAAALAVPLTRFFGDVIGMQAFRIALPYNYSIVAGAIWAALALTGAAAASGFAARRASRMSVRQALATL